MIRPPREELRTAILWCARMLVSYGDGPFAGPIRVSVSKPEEKESSAIKPRGTTEGMEPPAWVVLGVDESAGVSASELLRVLLSPDETKLMVDLVTHQPCSATSVADRCKATLGKSEFWAVWAQLQGRDLVEQGEDDRYRIGPEWLAKWLRAGEKRAG